MNAHPAADLFPLLADDDMDRLAADIKTHGLRHPVVTYQGQVLDGRNRLTACARAGVEPRFNEYVGDDPIAYVLSANVERRHLDASQLACVAVKLLPLLEEQARGRQGTRTDLDATSGHDCPEVQRARDQAGERVGVSGRYVSDAKTLAEQAPAMFDQVEDGALTLPAAMREFRREENRRLAADAVMPTETDEVDVVYADPPWQYDFAVSDSREIENQYPTMTVEEIKAYPVPAAKDCVLILWATSPKLREALEVLDGWGFRYVTSLVWVKDRIGMGYYARQQHEWLLIGVKGDPPVPLPENRPPSVISAPRTAHSAKPEEAYAVIERMWPNARRGELFLRGNPRPGWQGWGLEALA